MTAGSYDFRLVALSLVIAICASYTALDLAGRVTPARGRARVIWLIGGAAAMGLGIWSMRYMGMLAFGIAMIAIMILGLAILSSLVDRRYSAQTLALASAEQRYRLLFERSLAGVIRTTLDARILDCNHACARILGYASREELIASPVTNRYVHREDQDVFLARLKEEKNLTHYEHCLRRKDGSPVWVLGSAHLVEAQNGAPAVREETLIDITERKKAEEIFRTSSVPTLVEQKQLVIGSEIFVTLSDLCK